MKRKLLAALCITAMSAGLLAGCGSSEKAEDTSKSQETSAEDTSEQESKTDTKTESGTSRMQIRRVQMLRREYFWIPQKSLQEHIMQR